MPQKIFKQHVELHSHLGSAIHPSILWAISHRQGIKLPTKSYWEFEDMITMTGEEKNKNLDQMDKNFFHWTELIQSSPEAIEESVKWTIAGGFRKSNIVLHELRFNPMKRNRSGERDLDHTIYSALWGTERAMLEYPQVRAGIILMMGRSLSFTQNEIIANKAIKYKNEGVIGLDIADPERKTFSMKKHAPLFKRAREAGLGITIHTGEAGSLEELKYVVNEIKPNRIGHGILCVKDKKIMEAMVKNNITLEICPTSNLRNSVVKNVSDLKNIIHTLIKHGVKFTINTDGPEMYKSNIVHEEEFLRKNGILTQSQLDQCTKWAFEASFIR